MKEEKPKCPKCGKFMFLIIAFIMLVLSLALVIGFVYLGSKYARAQSLNDSVSCYGNECPSVLLRNPWVDSKVDTIESLRKENEKLSAFASYYARLADSCQYK